MAVRIADRPATWVLSTAHQRFFGTAENTVKTQRIVIPQRVTRSKKPWPNVLEIYPTSIRSQRFPHTTHLLNGEHPFTVVHGKGFMHRSLTLTWSIILGILPAAAAEGTRLIGTGPVQVGTAGAGVASPQNSSWLSLNPASLVDVSRRVDVSSDIINGRVEVTPQGVIGNSSNGTMEDSVVVFAPAMTWVKSADGEAFALGFYTVSGLTMTLPEGRSSPGAAGGFDTTAEQRFMTTSAAYARTIADGLSMGLAVNLNYVDFHSNTITFAESKLPVTINSIPHWVAVLSFPPTNVGNNSALALRLPPGNGCKRLINTAISSLVRLICRQSCKSALRGDR